MQIFTVGKATIESQRVRPRLKDSKGFTLIELMVGMAVIGVILSVVVGGIGNLFDAQMKDASNKLAATIRYLYNKSATERLYFRMVYDLDDQSYHVESSTEKFLVAPIDPKAVQKLEKVAEGKGDDAEAAKRKLAEIQGRFGATESYLLKTVKLGDGVSFKDVQTSYQNEKIFNGKAYTYFFPNGFATPTIVNLIADDDETNYSLEVFPLSGRVRVASEYREMERGQE